MFCLSPLLVSVRTTRVQLRHLLLVIIVSVHLCSLVGNDYYSGARPSSLVFIFVHLSHSLPLHLNLCGRRCLFQSTTQYMCTELGNVSTCTGCLWRCVHLRCLHLFYHSSFVLTHFHAFVVSLFLCSTSQLCICEQNKWCACSFGLLLSLIVFIVSDTGSALVQT